MRVTKRLSLGLALLVLALAVGIGAYVFVVHGLFVQESDGRIYQVQYVWDHGIKSLRITNAKTGIEDADRKWGRKIAAVAQEELPKIVQSAGLTRAVGRFHVDSFGYLPQVGFPTVPDLVRDPDVTPMMSALDQGDSAKARRLIAAGANVNAADQHGMTALMLAVAGGDAATVQALLAAGANVNAANKDGETALFPAAFLGRVAVVEELVRHGANVNATSKYGITPLMEGAQHSLLVERFLLTSGANVNAKNLRGETALMAAVWAERADIVKAFIRAGADVNTLDNEGDTSLRTATRRGYKEIVRLLKLAGAKE